MRKKVPDRQASNTHKNVAKCTFKKGDKYMYHNIDARIDCVKASYMDCNMTLTEFLSEICLNTRCKCEG